MVSDEHARKMGVQVVAAVFMPVATIAVMLRCYVRARVVRAFGLDDAAMVFASLFYIAFCASMIGGTLYGTGYKFENLEPDNRSTAMSYWWFCEVAYCFASIGCKISVCIFLMRITVKRSHIWTLYIVMILTVIAGLIFFFLMLLQCKPLNYFWTRTKEDPSIEGHCIDINIIIIMTYIYSVFAAMCDFTVGILPIFLVRKLHMKKNAKLAVIGILSMACIASSAVIVRLPFVATFAEPDFLYSTYQIAIWSCTEAGLGITAGSLATLRPLLRHWLGSRSENYPSSGFPRNSNPRLGNSGQRAVPLGSMDASNRSELRPDKLAVMVTNIESQGGLGSTWTRSSTPNSSEEGLTIDHSSQIPHLPHLPSGRKMEVGIQQTFEVTTATEDYGDRTYRDTSVKEHV
ncbi:hypothetical protein N7466_000465 [Penicillium verhagenii]|uniref:uncharacterized protein n=1 Tax=Penicillium verhagenii TaxID=1562060 RepID=UPI002544D4FA|nr:uncharacterized protein N7466_000465 [Penicillium verhagenii]KAJ5947450.1 hypothetical protein N7466_000465 [Penicillium verhagenii]